MAHLEHVNLTVADADATAQTLVRAFGWTIRWEGSVRNGAGRTVHVGDETGYLALYAPASPAGRASGTTDHLRWLNHIGIVVDDLDATEARVRAAGFVPRSHADYAPGQRFYFDGPDGIEYEVASYA